MSPVLSCWVVANIQARDLNMSSPFAEQKDGSFRSVGIAMGIAIFALLVTCKGLLAVIIVRRRRQQQQMPMIPSAQRATRERLFPLSMPTLLSRPAVVPINDSQEHILASRNHRQQRLSPKTSVLARDPSLSDATTLTSNTAKNSKFGSDISLETLQLPLPPPPSYQDITVDGAVRSVSVSSWVTEGPIEVAEPAPMGRSHGGGRRLGMRKPAPRGGTATRRM